MKRVDCTSCGAAILPATFLLNSGLCGPCAKKRKAKEKLRKHNEIAGCPSCDGTNFINFNWEFAVTGNVPELAKYPKYLVPSEKLKNGSLWKCQVCENWWYLNETQNQMNAVPKERQGLLVRWNSLPLEPLIDMVKTLSEIGATPPDIYGNGQGEIRVPCRVITKSNETYDCAWICFAQGPPLDLWPSKTFLLDEVLRIEPSPFALPKEIRVATADAEEVRMCFSPTMIEAPDRKLICLNGTNDFFVDSRYKPDEMKLAQPGFHERDAEYYNAKSGAACFFGDWSEKLTALWLLPLRPRKTRRYR